MSLESARDFLVKLKSDEIFNKMISNIESKENRRKAIAEAGFVISHEEFIAARAELSEADLTMIEDISFFRSDKRKAGMEMCCCCGVGGTVE